MFALLTKKSIRWRRRRIEHGALIDLRARPPQVKTFANKLYRKEGQFLVCESTKKWVFKRAGPIF